MLNSIVSIGLTFPPWAEVLVPKTQILFLQHLAFGLVFAYGIDGQDDYIISKICSFPPCPLTSLRDALAFASSIGEAVREQGVYLRGATAATRTVVNSLFIHLNA
ncbi:hypothetical protein [Nostoc sp. ChiQUE01b]|uniref:hypothetical protein n=1 Tax=Nostoc sp. ChiQUE01b TaxID=3075376 RepID=UPI002AD4B6A0|nr:hypothetical protein [Nostoc sp. ChiQUE01b]MDZ8264312.1 hypothetical protein [Nostoc sp. ChiQUE01b]